jgi:signal transduction histidine kinase
VQHGEKGRPIGIWLDGRASDEVQIDVCNAGTIPPESLPHLFNPFAVHKRSRQSGKGLGLGLYIVQQIALAHGGSVVAESNAALGTRMRVRLPRTAKPRVEANRP